MIHAKRYFAALTVVLTLLGAYALAVVPWLEPPPIARKPGGDQSAAPAPSPETQTDLARLFPPGSWELDNPKIVETDACTLLVKDYQPTPDGRLELMPCTLIFYAEGGAGQPRRPIVLQSPQGAMIQFDKAIDIQRAEVGRLIGGRLPGEITIRSPETSPGAGDELHLTTRNIQIDRQRVFTPHEVVFNFGASHGRGRDLTIALLPKDPEDPSSGIGGVRSLTLAKIEHLHLEMKGQGLLPAMPGAGKASQSDAPLEVTCQGPFVFDVTNSTALFDDGVEVLRINPSGLPDKLTCRQLLLVLADSEKSPTDSGKTEAEAATSVSSKDSLANRLERMVAKGNPVTLEAPSQATRIVAGEIEYVVPKRRLVLKPASANSSVSLVQQDNEFVARELEYEMAEPGRLGRMWAAGTGRLKFAQGVGPARQFITANWDKDLRIQPDGETHVISVVENASLGSEMLGQFAAREVHLWVREVERRGAGVSPAERNQKTEDKEGKRQFTILPDRLLALGSVKLDSPRLNVRTTRLESWFVHLPAIPQEPKPKPLPPIGPVDPAAHSHTDEPMPAKRLPSLQHFDLAGDLIQMQIVRAGEEMNLENLTIRGHVSLDEPRTPEPGQQPIHMAGDLLELRGGVSGPGKIDIIGQPAEVGGRGMSLAGNAIHLVRDENRLWIEGPGEAKVPAVEIRNQGAGIRSQEVTTKVPGSAFRAQKPSAAGTLTMPTGPINIVWQEGLTFDGQTAEITGDVQARTKTQVATCKKLEATLSTPINFADMENATADLGKLKLDGGVHVVSRSVDERGEQQSYDQLQVRDLVIDRAAGSLYAAGPGWLSSTRVGKGLPGPAETSLPATTPADPNTPPKLNYIFVSFEGEIVGDLAKREIQVQRLVRTTFAPVNDWDTRVEVNRLEDLGEKGVLMTSERLTVTEMAPAGQPAWIEASASGNTVVEGKNFTVHAPRITYTSDKEVLSLEGDGRADAELWYRTVPGQPSSYGAASKWRYWLRTGLFDVEGARPFEFQLNGIDKIRLPGRR